MAEALIKDIVSALKRESEKERAFEASVASALLRGFAHAVASLASALVAGASMPEVKFCRGMFRTIASLMDMAAMLGKKRRPRELEFHVENIVAGVEDRLPKGADAVLSAWLFYDGYARGLDDRPTSYAGKTGQLRCAALVGFRDVLACAHDLLEASGHAVDARAAARIDRLLDKAPMRLQSVDLQQLRHHCPERADRRGRGGSASDDD